MGAVREQGSGNGLALMNKLVTSAGPEARLAVHYSAQIKLPSQSVNQWTRNNFSAHHDWSPPCKPYADTTAVIKKLIFCAAIGGKDKFF